MNGFKFRVLGLLALLVMIAMPATKAVATTQPVNPITNVVVTCDPNQVVVTVDLGSLTNFTIDVSAVNALDSSDLLFSQNGIAVTTSGAQAAIALPNITVPFVVRVFGNVDGTFYPAAFWLTDTLQACQDEPTATNTPVPPTATPTNTPAPPTETPTDTPEPTATNTPELSYVSNIGLMCDTVMFDVNGPIVGATGDIVIEVFDEGNVAVATLVFDGYTITPHFETKFDPTLATGNYRVEVDIDAGSQTAAGKTDYMDVIACDQPTEVPPTATDVPPTEVPATATEVPATVAPATSTAAPQPTATTQPVTDLPNTGSGTTPGSSGSSAIWLLLIVASFLALAGVKVRHDRGHRNR